MTEKNPNQTENKPRKNTPVLMIFISVVLFLVLGIIVISYFSQKKRMFEMETMLTHEKDSLANELRLLLHGYDTLKTNNDTLQAKLDHERDRIVQLLAINASNVQTIRTYRNEINTMREIMKSYIVQIDSLNTRNKILIAENQDIKQQMSRVQESNAELSKAREELSSKVEIASVVQAKDILAVALNKNRKETTRLDRIEKLRICFTLRENPIAAAGEKTVFLRVLRPDSLVITSSPENLFDYKDSKLIYTASRDVEYMNQDIEMCIFVDNNGDFITGTYKADLFIEGTLIGSCTFMLTRR